jgi:hypothetical protein
MVLHHLKVPFTFGISTVFCPKNAVNLRLIYENVLTFLHIADMLRVLFSNVVTWSKISKQAGESNLVANFTSIKVVFTD